MERFKYLFLPFSPLAALFVVVLLVGNTYQPTARVYSPTVASSTLQVVPNEAVLAIVIPDTTKNEMPTLLVPIVSRVQSPNQATSTNPKKVTKVVPVQTITIPIAPAVAPEVLDASLNAAATTLRAALVNIICLSPVGGGLHSISGSGVVIDPKGIILTNAHVAQLLLLTDRGVSCRIRTGSPAADRYTAGLIYLPPVWINANASILTEASPSGTGEYDFALIGITKSLTLTPLPTSFPFIPLARLPLSPGAPVVIGSYGAQFLNYNQIQSNLSPTMVFGSVKDVFTFAKNTIDVLALGGSAAAQEGSSGGGVANTLGELVGTITTSTMEGATASRQLDAITASYIRAEYLSEMGESLDTLLATPVSTTVYDFLPVAASLEAVIAQHLP